MNTNSAPMSSGSSNVQRRLTGRTPMATPAAARYGRPVNQTPASAAATPILRSEIGDVLRDLRLKQGRTLREVSADARVSLGYLSEVERGQKEASSELLGAICVALGVPLSLLLREVSDRIAAIEGVQVPDTVPDAFMPEVARFS
ncbi:helix-turn-helix domain-containing protein [Buchananella felis]|uniref:helix-turn-helix domain-containing protein n=1 Tax=Buchananella felis TaxID=3231492 RepID=UPI0035298F96